MDNWQQTVELAALLVIGIIHLDRRITRLEGYTKFRRSVENDLLDRIKALESKSR